MVEDEDGGRIKRNNHGPCNQTDGVKKIHDLEGHQTCDNRKDKNTVTKPSERLIVKTFSTSPFSEKDSIEEIDGGSHGTKPPAEEIAKDKNEEKHSKAWKHSQDDPLFCEDRDDPDKGIKPKVEIDWNLDFEWKCSLNDQIEEEGKREDLNRPPQIRDCFGHVALTFLTRTFERSISPSPNS